MILIADSGSTKTDWCLIREDDLISISTQGITPVHQSREDIEDILTHELLPQINREMPELRLPAVESVFFYGSGCRQDLIPQLTYIIQNTFPESKIEVGSDLLAAARALLGEKEGIAAILGTGANSCLYDGHDIIENTPALGYILGDEGSGAVLGKNFINAVFKRRLPQSLIQDMNLDINDIINRVYRQPLPNRYLASLAPLIKQHINTTGVRELIVQNFIDFFEKNISPYGRPELPVNVVGSIAYYLQPEFMTAAEITGYKPGIILRTPIEGLIAYHKK